MKSQQYRDYIYQKSLRKGESLMPQDVADIMTKANNGGRFKKALHQLPSIRSQFQMLVDVYESCGFDFPDKEFTVERYQDFF